MYDMGKWLEDYENDCWYNDVRNAYEESQREDQGDIMNKITPEVCKNINTFSKALETYYEFFGELPDLAKKEDRAELYCIYTDLKYVEEQIKERKERRAE